MTTADQTGEISTFSIDRLKIDDLADLQIALEAWIRDSETHELLTDEIAEVNERMRGSVEGNNGYRYFVARDIEGKAVGVMGLRTPEEKMMAFVTTTNPIEIVNAYMSPATRGKGAGKALIQGVFLEARNSGYTEVILNSGPRYKKSAWGFYDHIFGGNCAIAKDYYGTGYHAPIWKKVF